MSQPTRLTLSRKTTPGDKLSPNVIKPSTLPQPLHVNGVKRSTPNHVANAILSSPKPPRVIKPRSPRQMAREMALQVVYHGLINPEPIELIIAQIISIQKMMANDINSSPSSMHRRNMNHPAPALPLMERKPIAYAGALLQPLSGSESNTPSEYLPLNPPHQKQPVPKQSPDRPFFRSLALGISAQRVAMEEKLSPLLDRAINEVTPMVRAILILGAYELDQTPVTPVQVILNESVELAKRYASEEAYRYVNGVLEKLALLIRHDEMQSLSRRQQSQQI